jgi:hypothetical protein
MDFTRTERPAEAEPRRSIRFRLTTLLAATALLAVVLTAGMAWYEWYAAIPAKPLWEVVDRFNDDTRFDPIGQHEPKLTVGEVLAAIQAHIPSLPSNVRPKYERIALTSEVPPHTVLIENSKFTDKNSNSYTVWWINLSVHTYGNNGYDIRIRETNHPKAKPPNEPPLPQNLLSAPSSP